MARAGKVFFEMNFDALRRNLEASISRVQRGTKKATIAACEDIKEESLKQVPRDTETLANSFFYEVHGSIRNFSAVIGYGGNGDPINPKTGEPASKYMVAVHEDLQANHPIGKAKYLEDPIRQYQQKFGARAADFIKSELE